MTDRIDDLIQRLMERDFEVEGVPCITLTNAIRKIRQWAGEQKPVSDNGLRSAVKRIAYRNGNLYGADVRSDLRDILNRTSSPAKLDPDTGAALAGIKELHAEFGPTNYDDPATTPYPVAGGCDCGRHVDENGDQIHYSNCPLSNKPVAGEPGEKLWKCGKCGNERYAERAMYCLKCGEEAMLPVYSWQPVTPIVAGELREAWKAGFMDCVGRSFASGDDARLCAEKRCPK